MILADLGESWLAVCQNDHAALAADFLSLWTAEGLPDHEHREALLFAARHHDDGWLEQDSAPRCRTDGDPHDFRSMPTDARLEIWLLGVARHVERRDLAALLIVEHALQLHRRPPASASWAEAMDRWRELRVELIREIGISSENLVETYAWLDTADTLSLAACGRWREPFEIRGRKVSPIPERENMVLGLDPFPLAGATTFDFRARRIPKQRFDSDAALAMQLALARWQKFQVRMVPGSEL